jgi:hypothetical protein
MFHVVTLEQLPPDFDREHCSDLDAPRLYRYQPGPTNDHDTSASRRSRTRGVGEPERRHRTGRFVPPGS